MLAVWGPGGGGERGGVGSGDIEVAVVDGCGAGGDWDTETLGMGMTEGWATAKGNKSANAAVVRTRSIGRCEVGFITMTVIMARVGWRCRYE